MAELPFDLREYSTENREVTIKLTREAYQHLMETSTIDPVTDERLITIEELVVGLSKRQLPGA